MPNSNRVPACILLAACSVTPGICHAQQTPASVVKMTAVNQAAVSQPQYTEVDVPLLKQGLPQKTGGRFDVTLATWTERCVNRPDASVLTYLGTKY